ncbi:HNH endonuclease, partial [Gordonia sp. NPDC003424]
GQTTSENMNPKCRPWHLLKTFSGWLDYMWRDDEGRLRTETVTPEGLVIPGEAETMEELFPGLRRIRYTATPQAPPTQAPPIDRPTRTHSRTANKHARRRAERNRNHKRHHDGPPPPF